MASDNMYETGSPFIMTGADIVRMGDPADMLVGGKNATPAVGGEGFSRLADAARLTDIKTEMIGKDFCISGYILLRPLNITKSRLPLEGKVAPAGRRMRCL